MTDILTRRLAPSPDAAASAVGDETVILHLVNGAYYGLDPVGTRIWQLICEGVTMPSICQQLTEEFDVDLARIEVDARAFLTDLMAQGILVDG